jgi:hypothetical protein
MPIKFRCPHCQQFLGISRSKAGAVTDCPTCGRTIRVPDLDGKISPLPKPKLDYADTGLARALSELANLGVAGEPQGDGSTRHSPQPEAIVLAPPPVVEAVSLPVPLPPEPMPHVDSAAPAALPVSQTKPGTQSPDALWGPMEELAALRPASRREAAAAPRPASFPLLVGIACGLLGLGAGFLLGRMTGDSSETTNPPAVAPQAVPPVPAPAPAGQPAEEVSPPAQVLPASDRQRAIEGRVTYVNADGESRPDSGARILVLPATREGASKLAVDSFRTGASDADLRVAQASIRALGGDFVLAGPDGHYEIQLPAAGKFQLLMVSKYQGRGSGSEGDPAGIAALKNWFDKPQLLLGQTLSTLTTVQFDGQIRLTRDHEFPKAE